MESKESISLAEELADKCRKLASRRAPDRERDPCYRLIQHAVASPSSDAAWEAVVKQYSRLVNHWLGQQPPDEDMCQEVFIRFWRALQGDASRFESRFANTSAVMGFLKRCALAVRIEAWRERERTARLHEKLCDAAASERAITRARTGPSSELTSLVLSKLTDERERVVFVLTYCYGMAPREVQAERPDLFPETRAVHRVKENLLRRLRRDPDVQEWRDSHQRTGDDVGGNAADSPVQQSEST